jgi:CHAT domain-containing protein/tetratricopeptide (TPR) repeat protein
MDNRKRQAALTLGLVLALLLATVLGSSGGQEPDREAALRDAVRKGEDLKKAGKYAEAIPLFEKAVALAEVVHGADDPNTASLVNTLGYLHKMQGQYAKAEPLYLRSLKILEERLGKDDPLVAANLGNLALLYQERGEYARAEPLLQRSLAIREARLGKDHPEVAISLSNLGGLYLTLGDYVRAEAYFQRSLRIREKKLPANDPALAVSLNNLGLLSKTLGKYDQAEPLYKQSLEIRESRLGKDHPAVAVSLTNLAALYQAQRKYREAEKLYRRSQEIDEQQGGKDHANVALDLLHLASLYRDEGQTDRAEPLLQRCLEIREKAFGPEHPQVAVALANLGNLYRDQGKLEQAETLYRRSLKMLTTRLGEEHPDVAADLVNLGGLLASREQWDEAGRTLDRGLHLKHRQARLLATLPLREQLHFLQIQLQAGHYTGLSLALERRQDARLVELSAEWLLNGKALTQQALAEPLALARDAGQGKLYPIYSELLDVRKRLANLALAVPAPGQEKRHHDELERVTRREEELVKELVRDGEHQTAADTWVTLADVRKALPADAVLIDVARFPVWDFRAKGGAKSWLAARYVAWIVPPAGQGDVRLIDLGEASKIEPVVRAVRETLQASPRTILDEGEVEAESRLAKPLRELSALVLQPLLPHVEKSRRWLISPDASLWLVPWSALPLPDGSFAVEKYTVSHLVSGRDLVRVPSKGKAGSCWVLADPDYDLAPAERGKDTGNETTATGVGVVLRNLVSGGPLPRFTRLPGTAAEARAIVPKLKAYAGQQPELRTGKEALEVVCKSIRHPRVLILSTHGFFQPDQAAALPELQPLEGTPALVGGGKPLENPLLRCGLALAGANRRTDLPPGAEDGILTGLEAAGTDLPGCELVVLSACETGLGDVHYGEGVSGLRQAFQLAGAHSVLATLWQIPDRETAPLMSHFFDNLAKKQDKAEALRQAQLALIKHRRETLDGAAHPFFWAAFTLTGN